VQATTTTTTGSTSANLRERDAEFSLSWCSARYLPPQLVIACNVGGGAGVVKVNIALCSAFAIRMTRCSPINADLPTVQQWWSRRIFAHMEGL
jgi:hypothetical protein